MSEAVVSQITDHVYWMPPAKPDRPSLGAVVGTNYTLMLDAGASVAHARLFLAGLVAAGVRAPRYLALTHWHWDHVFGAIAFNGPVIAHATTAEQLTVMANYDWSDGALDQRVASGAEIVSSADDIKAELPKPRDVQIVTPDIVFQDALTIQLGDATCHIQHVGGDHALDSCVMFVTPDRVLFLGDCLYDAVYAPVRYYTTKRLFPLLDTILNFDAEYFVEGHTTTVMTRTEIEGMASKMRRAGALVYQFGAEAIAALTQEEQSADEDMLDFVQAFIVGKDQV